MQPDIAALPDEGERRSRLRTSVRDLAALLGSFHQVKVINLSPAGMGVRSHASISVGRRYQVRFVAGTGGLTLFATVRWCCLHQVRKREDGECETVYHGGLVFERGLAPNFDDLLSSSLPQELTLCLDDGGVVTLETGPPTDYVPRAYPVADS